MAELQNRLELEADFARALAKLSGPHRRELVKLLGEPPDPRNIPPEFWAKVEKEHKQTLVSLLLLLFMASSSQHIELWLPKDLRAAALEELQPVGQAWAEKRAGALSDLYVKASQKRLGQLGRRWYGPDFKVGSVLGDMVPPGSSDVMDGVTEIFGPVRDANIAVTETTRAATAGFDGAHDEAVKAGVKLTVIWHCEKDGRQCPWCNALHLQRMKDWEAVMSAADFPEGTLDEVVANRGPPAHVSCRCWLTTEELKESEDAPYGRCPECGANGISRERRKDGNDRCGNGHEYPSRDSIHEAFDPEKHPRDDDGLFTAVVGGNAVLFVPHPHADKGDRTLMVDVAKLDALWSGHEYDGPDFKRYIPKGGGGGEIEGRREGFTKFMATGKAIEAPRINITDRDTVEFDDGRHRFSVLRDQGASRVAVTVRKADYAKARKLLGDAIEESLHESENVSDHRRAA